MPKRQTSKPLRKERLPGADRVQKYVGKRKVSFYYQHVDGTSETIASAEIGDRKAIAEAEVIARRKALDIQQGKIIAGSVAEAIERFRLEIDPTHFLSQSKDAKSVRDGEYANLKTIFGGMQPSSLKMIHGYQYLDARAAEGAPIKANKEMALMSTMCNKWVRWGLIEVNPFIGLEQNKGDKDVRTVQRHHIIRFYLWARRQANPVFKTAGCAALFTYLTGFRAAEVRPFHVSGLRPEGVQVVSAKRKKGEEPIVKLRDWSTRLRVVVERAKQAAKEKDGKIAKVRPCLFGNKHGQAYTKSGWGSIWEDAMWEYIASIDELAAATLVLKKEYEVNRRRDKTMPAFKAEFKTIDHPMYFSLLDVRPAAITKKKEQRSADTYDFAAHANPATTDRHYDRRKVRRASATE
jgi:hypothetical protein